MRRTLTDGNFSTEFWQQLATYQHTAWRWENQPVYEITDERASVEAYLAGHPADPLADPYLAPWMRQVAEQTRNGRRIGRVRVFEEPPTEYQRWELWLDPWNRAAGEEIDYLTRSQARRIGPTPGPRFAPDADWWLFDAGTPGARLVIMHFDPRGVRVRVELSTEPHEIALAETWRDLATLTARAEQTQRAA